MVLLDVEAGLVVAFVHFAGSLPDFHVFQMRNGQVERINAVVGPGGVDGLGSGSGAPPGGSLSAGRASPMVAGGVAVASLDHPDIAPVGNAGKAYRGLAPRPPTRSMASKSASSC